MNYTCPYCNQPTTITTPNKDNNWVQLNIAAEHLKVNHKYGIRYEAISCPNRSCKELYLIVKLTKSNRDDRFNWNEGVAIQEWQLLPESSAKPQPDYIPRQLITDYQESCRIKALSPKASATLARRCLQGMIHDFWAINKGNLKKEIDALEEHISTETWEAIDSIRSVGNIGAHMENDVNLIVDIEPEEADLLINLIEDLFIEWYVVRHDRQERQRRLKALADEKNAARKKQPLNNTPEGIRND
jgi:hypothetical protein